MKNHGEILRELMKARGYDIKRLSNALTVSRVSVEKDLKKTEITRRSLTKYLGVLFDSFEDFYENRVQVGSKPTYNENKVVTQSLEFQELQKKYMDLQARFIELQSEHLQLTKRFFPNAVQRNLVTA